MDQNILNCLWTNIRKHRRRQINKFFNGYAKITGYTSSTVVTINIEDDFDNTNAVTDWKLGAFSETTGQKLYLSLNKD